MRLGGLREKFVLSLVFGVAVVLGLTLYGNGALLLTTLGRFQWALLPAVLALTLVNYGLRFLKWQYYLGQIGARARLGDSFAIFSCGLAMAMTPGKVGEVLKPVLLRLRIGVPVSRSVPVVMAERLTDGIAMLVLALAGFLLWGQAWQVLAASLALAVICVAFLGSAAGGNAILGACRRLPYVGNRMAHVELFLQSSRALFTPVNLALAIAIGVVSWGCESLAFYLVLLGLGIHPSLVLLIQATFVLATSTLVGSLSMLPGGLGAADASVTGLLLLVVKLTRVRAVAATLLVRFCTLWFGVALGLIALFLFRHRFTLPEEAQDGASAHLGETRAAGT